MRISPVSFQSGKSNLKAAVPALMLVAASPNAEAQPPHHYHRPPQTHHYMPHHHYHNPYFEYVLPTMFMLNFINSMSNLNNYYNYPVSVGGTTFNQTEISNADSYYKNNILYNSVTLIDGTNVTFPKQPENRFAMVYRSGGKYYFDGLQNATITGSDRKDNMVVRGCVNTLVAVGDDDRSDRVFVSNYRLINGVRQYTKNVDVVASKGDIVNNEYITEDYTDNTYN